MVTIGISQAWVDSLKVEKESLFWDSVACGLGLRVLPTGKKTWVRKVGKRRVSIGDARETKLKDARKAVFAYREEKSKRKLSPEELLVREACAEYLDHYAKKQKKSWKKDKQWIDKYINPLLGNKLLSEVTRRDAVRFHAGIPYTYSANRTLEVLRGVYNYAIKEELFYGPNPASGLSKNQEQRRDNFIPLPLLPELYARIKSYPNCYASGALLLLLYTGRRKMEVLSLKWQDIFFEEGFIRFSTTKTRDNLITPITPQIKEVLEGLPKVKNNPHIFIGLNHGAHLKDLRRPWVSITKDLCPGLRIHDIRHTAATYMVHRGVHLREVAEVLGQSYENTAARYSHVTLPKLTETLTDFNSFLVQTGTRKGS